MHLCAPFQISVHLNLLVNQENHKLILKKLILKYGEIELGQENCLFLYLVACNDAIIVSNAIILIQK